MYYIQERALFIREHERTPLVGMKVDSNLEEYRLGYQPGEVVMVNDEFVKILITLTHRYQPNQVALDFNQKA